MKEKLEHQISEAILSFLKKENNLLYFLLNKTYREALAKEAYYNKEIREIINRDNPKIIENFEKSEEKLKLATKGQVEFYNELTYKTYYQNFEEFISELLIILYKNLPRFLRKEILEINHKDLFEENNIDVLRSKIIEKKVKIFIQSNSIKDILLRFKRIFGIDLMIEESYLNDLYLCSKIRNILTHNSGIVNQTFLTDLHKEKIRTNYKLGEKIDLERELESIQELISKESKKISDQLIANVEQLMRYHNSI